MTRTFGNSLASFLITSLRCVTVLLYRISSVSGAHEHPCSESGCPWVHGQGYGRRGGKCQQLPADAAAAKVAHERTGRSASFFPHLLPRREPPSLLKVLRPRFPENRLRRYKRKADFNA